MEGGADGLLLLSCREARGCPHQASYEYIFPPGVYFVLHKSAGTLSTSSTPRYGWTTAGIMLRWIKWIRGLAWVCACASFVNFNSLKEMLLG